MKQKLKNLFSFIKLKVFIIKNDKELKISETKDCDTNWVTKTARERMWIKQSL